MDKLIATFTWFFENIETIMACFIAIFGALGIVVESIKKILPTKTDKSALESVAKFLVKVGEILTAGLKFIPSNMKKAPAAKPVEEAKKE